MSPGINYFLDYVHPLPAFKITSRYKQSSVFLVIAFHQVAEVRSRKMKIGEEQGTNDQTKDSQQMLQNSRNIKQRAILQEDEIARFTRSPTNAEESHEWMPLWQRCRKPVIE